MEENTTGQGEERGSGMFSFSELIREDISNLKKQEEKQKSQQHRQWEKVFS